MGKMISAEQAAAYKRDGFLVIPGVFSAGEVDVLRGAVDTAIEAGRGVERESLAPDVARRVRDPAKAHPALAAAVRDPRIITIVSALLGPNIRAMKGKLNLKPARVGSAVEFHQDWAFYPHTNDDLATVSILLDDVTEENGPILVIPRSHTGPTLNHHEGGKFVGVIDPEVIRRHAARLVPLAGPAGSVTVHHVRIVHGSPPNLSDRDRRMLVWPVAAADAWPLAGIQQPLDLIYGEVIAGEGSITPRLADIPVRIPYPMAGGSLFDLQETARERYFT